MKRKTLYPVPEPIEVNPMGVIFMSFVFALAFFILGSAWRYYVAIGV